VAREPLAISYQLSAIGYQLSAIGYQLSAISYQLSAISYQLSAISYQLSAISYQLSAISDSVGFTSGMSTLRWLRNGMAERLDVSAFIFCDGCDGSVCVDLRDLRFSRCDVR
jgi:hypothetical protein